MVSAPQRHHRPGQLTLRQIEVFHAIMVTGSLSEAGRLLHVTQPVISRVLAGIEQRLGFALFERVKNKVQPTPEAHVLFEGVAAIHEGVERINDIALRLAVEGAGTLRIVSTPSFGEWLIPAALQTFTQRHANVRVRYRTMSVDMLQPYMLSGNADLALLSVPVHHPNLVTREVHVGEVVCALPAAHPLATASRGRRVPIDAAALACERVIGYATQTPFSDSLKAFWNDLALDPHIEVRSPVTALAMVRRGLGIALIDPYCLDPAAEERIVVRPLRPTISLSAHLAYPSTQPLSLMSRAFLQAFEDVIGRLSTI